MRSSNGPQSRTRTDRVAISDVGSEVEGGGGALVAVAERELHGGLAILGPGGKPHARVDESRVEGAASGSSLEVVVHGAHEPVLSELRAGIGEDRERVELLLEALAEHSHVRGRGHNLGADRTREDDARTAREVRVLQKRLDAKEEHRGAWFKISKLNIFNLLLNLILFWF